MLSTEKIPATLVLKTKGHYTGTSSVVVDRLENVVPGALYFAIAGHQFDGHVNADLALTRGASAAVVENVDVFAQLDRAILVRSTREAWAHAVAAQWGHPSRSFPLVGVTGTNGKTTTTFLLAQTWERLGHRCGLIGTVECRVGAKKIESDLTTPGPMALQSLFADMRSAPVDYAAMEVSSIALDQYRTAGTQFRIGVFTNLTQDHLDYHQTLDAYWRAKRRLFTDYGLACAVVNTDNQWGREIAAIPALPTVISYGVQDAKADFSVAAASFSTTGTRAELVTPSGKLQLVTRLIGMHNLCNALSVLAVNHALGISVANTALALSEATGAPGRLERVDLDEKWPSVFVDYAHSPDALDNVLAALRELRGDSQRRIITVFGCGGDRDRLKRPLMGAAACKLSDVVILTSDNPRTENAEAIIDEIAAGVPVGQKAVHRQTLRRDAIHLALDLAAPQDLVLIAGKGHENYQIIGTEKFAFDDREVVREYCTD